MGTALAHGDEVAAHLNALFEDHGPPLFLKRDNGGNLNHTLVEDLLEAFLVIPAELDIQTLNHRTRPCLGHRSPCQVFTAGRDFARTFHRRKRREVCEWIRENARTDAKGMLRRRHRLASGLGNVVTRK